MEQLTDRQLESLLAYLRRGTIRGAAEETGVYYTTVHGHLTAAARKLGVASLNDLGEAAVKAGIIRLEAV